MARNKHQTSEIPDDEDSRDPVPQSPKPHHGSIPGNVIFATSAFLLIVGSLAIRPWRVQDADVYWHLATGREMWTSGSLIRTDPFTYQFENLPWVNHEWLYQLLVWPLFQTWGPSGLFLSVGLTMAGACSLGYWAARQAAIPPSASLAATSLALACGLPFSQPRPTAWTLVAAGLILVLAPRVVQSLTQPKLLTGRNLWPPISLLLLFVFWANLHGTFPIGILTVTVLLGAGIAFHHPSQNSIIPSRRWLRLGLLLTLILLATLINPFGYGIHLVPLKVAGSSLFRTNNAEWSRPDFSPEFWPFYATIPLVLIGAIRGWRVATGPTVVGILFCILALGSRRMIPWYGILATPLLAHGLLCLRTVLPLGRSTNFPRIAVPALILVVLIYGWWTINHSGTPVQVTEGGLIADRGSYPVAMAKRLARLGPQGRVFNDYNHGGYLHLAVGPGWKVGMDGRNDLFGEDAVRDYEALATGRTEVLPVLDRNGVQAVLLSWPMALAEGGIYQQLAPLPGWVCAGFDDASILMVRRRGIAPEILAPYELAHYVPVLSFEANLQRARRNRQLPAMRAELDRLAREAPSRLALLQSARIAWALGDRAKALETLDQARQLTTREDPLLIATEQELGSQSP